MSMAITGVTHCYNAHSRLPVQQVPRGGQEDVRGPPAMPDLGNSTQKLNRHRPELPCGMQCCTFTGWKSQ